MWGIKTSSTRPILYIEKNVPNVPIDTWHVYILARVCTQYVYIEAHVCTWPPPCHPAYTFRKTWLLAYADLKLCCLYHIFLYTSSTCHCIQPVLYVACHQWSITNNLCMSLMHTSSYNIDIPQPYHNCIIHKSHVHWTNDPTYTISKYHNNHTKNASSIHHTIRNNDKNKHVTIPKIL